jgi:hypothetical protein
VTNVIARQVRIGKDTGDLLDKIVEDRKADDRDEEGVDKDGNKIELPMFNEDMVDENTVVINPEIDEVEDDKIHVKIYGRRTYANPDDKETWGYPYLPKRVSDGRKCGWGDAIDKEYNGFKSHGLFEKIKKGDVPAGEKITMIFVLFSWKKMADDYAGADAYTASDGKKFIRKVRAVFNGSQNSYGGYTASPTPPGYLIRFIYVLFSYYKAKFGKKWTIRSFDIGQAFLEAPIDVPTFAYPPDGFYGDEKWIWRLLKALYGLCQASRLWHLTFDKIVKAFGMRQSTYEPCLYYMQSEREGTLVEVLTIHVDDGLVIGEEELVNKLVDHIMGNVRKLKVEEHASLYLGSEYMLDNDGEVFIHQETMIEQACKRIGISDEPGKVVPMPENGWLTHLEKGTGNTGTEYLEIVGMAMYIVRMTHPEALFAGTYLCRFNKDHNEEHVKA